MVPNNITIHVYEVQLIVLGACILKTAAPKTSKIDTSEFEGKVQQLLTMGISEVRLTSYCCNLLVLVLKTRCPSGSQSFALVGVPEQALGGFPWVWIYFGMGDNPFEVS